MAAMRPRTALLLLSLLPFAVPNAAAHWEDCGGLYDTDCHPPEDRGAWCSIWIDDGSGTVCAHSPGDHAPGCGGLVDILCDSGPQSCDLFVRTFCVKAGAVAADVAGRLVLDLR